jgi:hypothetical protein
VNKIIDFKSGAPIDREPVPTISRRRQERIWCIFDMRMQGAETKEIAQLFGISQRQVQKDLNGAKRLSREMIHNWDLEGTLGREIRFLENTRREAMRQSQLSRQEAVRLGYIRLALDAATRLVALLQSTGLIRQVPQHVEITSNPFEDADLRRRFVGMLVEVRRHGGRISGIDY